MSQTGAQEVEERRVLINSEEYKCFMKEGSIKVWNCCIYNSNKRAGKERKKQDFRLSNSLLVDHFWSHVKIVNSIWLDFVVWHVIPPVCPSIIKVLGIWPWVNWFISSRDFCTLIQFQSFIQCFQNIWELQKSFWVHLTLLRHILQKQSTFHLP